MMNYLDELVITDFIKKVKHRIEDGPNDVTDWHTLAYGYFLGRGMHNEAARQLATIACGERSWRS